MRTRGQEGQEEMLQVEAALQALPAACIESEEEVTPVSRRGSA
jgi:hypothetical protein